MKSTFYTLLVACMIGATSSLKSQEICNSFCITNIEMDSLLPNVMNVTIFFEGDENDFINYPYVSAIVDLNWDTVGTGTLNFFGQFGNTSQPYQVNTIYDALPPNFRAYAHFDFDTISCLLYYNPDSPCSTTGIYDDGNFTELKIYPNPFTTAVFIEDDERFEELNLTLYNSCGQIVQSIEKLSGDIITLEREGLPAGVYFLHLRDQLRIAVKKVVIQ